MENQFLLARKLPDFLTQKRKLSEMLRYCDTRSFTLQLISYIDDNNQYAPFLVEDKIKELGGVYEKAPDWEVRIDIKCLRIWWVDKDCIIAGSRRRRWKAHHRSESCLCGTSREEIVRGLNVVYCEIRILFQ